MNNFLLGCLVTTRCVRRARISVFVALDWPKFALTFLHLRLESALMRMAVHASVRRHAPGDRESRSHQRRQSDCGRKNLLGRVFRMSWNTGKSADRSGNS